MTGVILVILSGVALALIGVALSHIALLKLNPISFLATSCFLGGIFGWCVIADWGAVTRVDRRQTLCLASLIFFISLLTCLGQFLFIMVMRKGHQAISWAIGQSAMVLPFVFSNIFWGERAGFPAWLGLALIVNSVILMSFDKTAQAKVVRPAAEKNNWFLLSIANMLIGGTVQCLWLIPSHCWADPMRLRAPLSMSVCALIHASVAVKLKATPSPRVWIAAAVWAILAGIFYMLLFPSIDHMASINMSSIVFPVSIGTCVLVFSLYSALIMKEDFKPLTILGLLMTFIGILLLAC